MFFGPFMRIRYTCHKVTCETTLLHNKLVNNLTKNLYFFPTPKFWNPYFFPVFSEKFLIVVMNVIFLFTFLLGIKSIGW